MRTSEPYAFYIGSVDDEQHKETEKLLNRIYNGTRIGRNFKEKRFFQQALGVYNRFTDLIKAYQKNPNPENEKAIRNDLSIDKELLGFKYWIIKKDAALSATFANDIIWNKKS